MIHTSLLRYRNSRYLWWSLLLVVVCIALYATQSANRPPNGGTWQGYTLGTVAALLILWLAWLGIRKRRYRSSASRLQGYVSAHVYLGTAVLLIATVHTGFQFGWNVHTLAYVLMCLVIVSGFYGVYAYMALPRAQSANRRGKSRETLFAELYAANERSKQLSRACEPDIQIAVQSSIERTAIGGGLMAQLLATDRSKFLQQPAGADSSADSVPVSNKDQQAIVDFVANRVPRAKKQSEAESLQALLSVLCARQAILRRIRADIQIQGWLQCWLYIHIPFTVALLGALSVHVISTFIYW